MGATSKMNRSAKGGARSSLHYGGEGALIHPPHTQPPDLQPVPLMDMGFAIICLIARHRMPQIRFLYIGSYVCSTLLSDPSSPERPCASLLLHLHQVVEGTFTPELSNMLGIQQKRAGDSLPSRGSVLQLDAERSELLKFALEHSELLGHVKALFNFHRSAHPPGQIQRW